MQDILVDYIVLKATTNPAYCDVIIIELSAFLSCACCCQAGIVGLCGENVFMKVWI